MDDSSLNFDIENYGIEELINIFKDEIDILNSDVIEIRNYFLNKTSGPIKQNVKQFLLRAMDKLIYHVNSNTDGSEFIIDYSKPVENFKSMLVNPNINKYYKRDVVDKLLVIDSRYRDNYFSTKSTDFILSRLGQNINDVIELKLSEIEFPNTWYPFSEDIGNTTFKIKYKSQTEYTEIKIPGGSYHYNSLINKINTTLSDNGFSSVTCKIDLSLDSTYGHVSGTGKVTFSSTGGDKFNLKFFDVDYTGEDGTTQNKLFIAQKRLGWNLGFREIKKNYYAKDLTTYTSEGLLDTVVLRYFYVIVNEFSNNVGSHINPICSNMNIINNNNMLARLSSNGNAFSVNNSNGLSLYSDTRIYFGPININKIQIKIINEFGDVINLNNMDISLTLQYKVLQTS